VPAVTASPHVDPGGTRQLPVDEGVGAATARPAPPGERRNSTLRSIVEWVVVLVVALVVALVIRTFLFATFWIPSASMQPTLVEQDRVVVNKLSYRLHDVNRGDVIVFERPPGEAVITENGREVKDLIKRVVALEGETVTVRDGDVFVDGRLLDEPYLPDGTVTPNTCGFTTTTVPENAVFVLGDNRSNSSDARCFAEHAVAESSIVGRAFVRIWPFSNLGGL
jgi:signal peptidase I